MIWNFKNIPLFLYTQFPFAILYFTGPDHFNRAIRNHASHLGYSLSDIVRTFALHYFWIIFFQIHNKQISMNCFIFFNTCWEMYSIRSSQYEENGTALQRQYSCFRMFVTTLWIPISIPTEAFLGSELLLSASALPSSFPSPPPTSPPLLSPLLPFLLFFADTSDHIFNALIYSISQGLVQCLRGLHRDKIATSTITVPCLSEAEVFSALGLAYKEPDERCFFLSPTTSKKNAQADGWWGFSQVPSIFIVQIYFYLYFYH